MGESPNSDELQFSGHPIEIFGRIFTDKSQDAKEMRSKQWCPYEDKICIKNRKSDVKVKIGICSLGYKPEFADHYVPVVICPLRFHSREIYKSVKENYFSHVKDEDIVWVPEVNLGNAGSIDFVLANKNDLGDFLAVEFQANGTTGTPWDALKDFYKTGKFSSSRYKFGLNWANEIVKTMMQQAYKKGVVLEDWKKKILFVIQDVSMEYLRANNDTSGLHSPNDEDPIHFATYKVKIRDNKVVLELQEKLSTNTDGIRRILSGSSVEDWPTQEQFVSNIRRRMKVNVGAPANDKQPSLSKFTA